MSGLVKFRVLNTHYIGVLPYLSGSIFGLRHFMEHWMHRQARPVASDLHNT